MTKIQSLLAFGLVPAAASAVLLAGAAWADASKTYDIAGFSRVSASASVDVVVKEGPFAVTAESSTGEFDYLVLERRGDTLVASMNWKGGWLRRSPHYTVTVTAPSYQGFKASSSASISGEHLSSSNVELHASSSADIVLSGLSGKLDVDASSSAKVRVNDLRLTDVKASADSSADITLTGACQNLEVSVSSSADFDGGNLKCQTVTARANSSADADVWASEAVNGTASSSGDIRVRGEPAKFEKSTSSSGSVRKS